MVSFEHWKMEALQYNAKRGQLEINALFEMYTKNRPGDLGILVKSVRNAMLKKAMIWSMNPAEPGIKSQYNNDTGFFVSRIGYSENDWLVGLNPATRYQAELLNSNVLIKRFMTASQMDRVSGRRKLARYLKTRQRYNAQTNGGKPLHIALYFTKDSLIYGGHTYTGFNISLPDFLKQLHTAGVQVVVFEDSRGTLHNISTADPDYFKVPPHVPFAEMQSRGRAVLLKIVRLV